MIRQEPSGWWLPSKDTYFSQFAPPTEYREGPPPKLNGFCREHIQIAFKHVSSWNVAVDVGAHVGWWAYEMCHRFKTVYAFEPSPDNYQCLWQNLKFDNIYMYPMAVGDKQGICEIRNDKQRPGNSGSHYIMPGTGKVPMVPLDEMTLPDCDLLKIDVEGFELNVLRGASRLIQTYRPVIIMECTDTKFRGRYDIPDGAAQRWLLKRGYREVAAMRPDKVFAPD